MIGWQTRDRIFESVASFFYSSLVQPWASYAFIVLRRALFIKFIQFVVIRLTVPAVIDCREGLFFPEPLQTRQWKCGSDSDISETGRKRESLSTFVGARTPRVYSIKIEVNEIRGEAPWSQGQKLCRVRVFEDEEFTRMCPVGFSVGDKAFFPDLDTLLATPTGPGLSHVRMALARYVFSTESSNLLVIAFRVGLCSNVFVFPLSFPMLLSVFIDPIRRVLYSNTYWP